MDRPTLRLTSVTVTTSDPHRLAAFYAALLGYRISAEEPAVPGDPDRGGWAQVRPADGETGPTLNLEFERHFQRPTWPSVERQQFATEHLDIQVDDLDVAIDWAVRCGAVLAPVQRLDGVRVMFDPDGHPFCLFR